MGGRSGDVELTPSGAEHKRKHLVEREREYSKFSMTALYKHEPTVRTEAGQSISVYNPPQRHLSHSERATISESHRTEGSGSKTRTKSDGAHLEERSKALRKEQSKNEENKKKKEKEKEMRNRR